ncbi:MAG: hypothetical protein EOP85_11935 [Verrucomicrobiaceae bacterium]|nr:MAG: hypothetical protein EOP85_11935 [Verrucomicrobiaceae bacterium]
MGWIALFSADKVATNGLNGPFPDESPPGFPASVWIDHRWQRPRDRRKPASLTTGYCLTMKFVAKNVVMAAVILTASPLSALEPGFYGISDGPKRFHTVAEEEKKADHKVWYEHDGRLDIGIGEIDRGARRPKTFTLAELDHYFTHQRHKGMVVVTFDKGAPGPMTVEDAISGMERFFFTRGYQRILFLHARGSGVLVHMDSIAPEK